MSLCKCSLIERVRECTYGAVFDENVIVERQLCMHIMVTVYYWLALNFTLLPGPKCVRLVWEMCQNAVTYS